MNHPTRINVLRHILTATLIYIGAPALTKAVIISSTGISVLAKDPTGPQAGVNFHETGIPTFSTITATQGASTSSFTATYTGVGDQVSLLHSYDQQRGGQPHSYAIISGNVFFTVSATTTYALSGDYDVTSSGGINWVEFTSGLYDLTTDEWIGRIGYMSHGTVLNIGQTGTLYSDHAYMWASRADTEAIFSASGDYGDSGASAVGFAALNIGGGAPVTSTVPESGASFLLLGAALAGMVGLRRFRRC